MFRLRLFHIKRSDFAFIWIRCSDFICITFASTAVRRSDFVLCISGIQTSSLYGSDVQTSSVSHLLAPQSNVQTSSSAYQEVRLHLYMDQMFRLVHTSSVSHLLAPQLDFQTSSSAYQTFRLRICLIHLE